MKTREEIERALAQCYGTEGYYKNTGVLSFMYTDGVKMMWEMCEAYWLLIAISSYRRKEEFQVWTLKVEDNTAVLTMKEDSDRPDLVSQKIPYTDFPLSEITMFLIDGVLILTTEY